MRRTRAVECLAALLWHDAAFGLSHGSNRLKVESWDVCCKFTRGQTLEMFTQRNGSSWPTSCDHTLRYVFTKVDNPVAVLWRFCHLFERLIGQDSCLTNASITEGAEGLNRTQVGLLAGLVGFMPRGRITWVQYLALSTMQDLCNKYFLAPPSASAGQEELCIQIVTRHVTRLLADHDFWHDWSDRRIAESLVFQGALGEAIFAVPRNWSVADAIPERQDELWTRFVKRAPDYNWNSTTTLQREESFGRAGLRSAESLVPVLLREPPLEALLPVLGEMRQRLAEELHPDGLGSERMGIRRKRYGQLEAGSVTVGSGSYFQSWRRRIREAVADESRIPLQPLGPFANPNSSDVVWSRRCGVVLTWVDLAWSECVHIVNKYQGAVMSIRWDGKNLANWMSDGVSVTGSTCRVVMNRAVLRPVLDGMLLGEDCKELYGRAFEEDASEIWKIFPVNYHASPLALELVERLVVGRLLSYYYGNASLLDRASGDAERLAILRVIGQTVASIYYYLSNISPFERGSPVAIAVLHHALWMRLAADEGKASPAAGRKVLRCLGLWRRGSYPPSDDCHAIRSDGDWFTKHLYGVLLEHPIVKSPDQLSACVLAALSQVAAEAGVKDREQEGGGALAAAGKDRAATAAATDGCTGDADSTLSCSGFRP